MKVQLNYKFILAASRRYRLDRAIPAWAAASAGRPCRFAFLFVFLGIFSSSYSQENFNFRRKLNPIDSAGWYSITLSPPFFKTSKQSFSDLRIYQFTEKDTLEAPYILTIHERQVTEGTLELPAINQSKKDGKQYLTFELKKNQYVNYLDLEFEEENYDVSKRMV
jgi:hypothetical protein